MFRQWPEVDGLGKMRHMLSMRDLKPQDLQGLSPEAITALAAQMLQHRGRRSNGSKTIILLQGEYLMPDRAMELRHLAQADRHISEGEGRVVEMERTIARAVLLKMNTSHARASLALIVDVLAQCKIHRLMILQALEDIDRCT